MSANLDYGSGIGVNVSPLLGVDQNGEAAPPPTSRRKEVFLCTYLVTVLTVVGGVCLRFGVEQFAMKTCHDFESSLSSTSPAEYPRWGRRGETRAGGDKDGTTMRCLPLPPRAIRSHRV